MKVIGAGLLRTGTLSTLTALVANILNKAGYSKVSAHKAPSFLLKIIGLFDREVKGMLPMLGKKGELR